MPELMECAHSFGELQVWGKEEITGSLARQPRLSQQKESPKPGRDCSLKGSIVSTWDIQAPSVQGNNG